jgi:hypothetical protein
LSLPEVRPAQWIGTILSGGVTATVSSGQLDDVGTIGTILSPIAIGEVAAIGTIGTLASGFVTSQQAFGQTNIQNNAVISTSGAATILTGTLQDMTVDAIYGSIISGSIQTNVMGVEPQSGIKTSTIVGGAWAGGAANVNQGQRLVAQGPLGKMVAVVWNLGANSTIVGVYMTAVQSTTM